MFLQRALVTITLAPLGLLLIYLGGWFFFLPISVLLLIATTEYANFMRHLGWKSPVWLMAPAVLLLLIDAQWPENNLFGLVLTASLFAVLLYALGRYERGRSRLAAADWLATMGGIVLLGWLGSHFLRLRHLDYAGQWAMLAILTIWLADIFAYLIGSRFGRHKLVPRLSPKKSIEGYVAGIVLGTLGAAMVAHLFFSEISVAASFLLGIILTTTAPAGDIGFSMLKREAGVKDSGHLFPGHGGALDRLDALLWGVAIAYYLIIFLLLS